MSSLLHARIEAPLSSMPGASSADSLIAKINKFKSVVENIRDENLELERVRDQYLIHLQQCQEDHETLRSLYKSLKQRFDRASANMYAGQTVPTDQYSTSIMPQNGNPIQSTPSLPSSSGNAGGEVLKPTITSSKYNLNLKFAMHIEGILCSVAYDKTGSKIAFSNGIVLYIIDSNTGQPLVQWKLPIDIDLDKAHCRSITFSPDGNLIAMTGSVDEIYLIGISPNTPQPEFLTLRGHTKEASSVVFGADGKTLISGGFDGCVLIWDVASRQEVRRIPHEPGPQGDCAIVGIAAAPDHSFYAVAFSSGSVRAYSSGFDSQVSFTGHESVMSVAVSPHDFHIATVAQDGAANVWLIRVAAQCVRQLQGHTDFALSAAFSPREPILVTGSKDQTVRLWDYQSGEALAVIAAHANTVFGVAHRPGAVREFVSVGGDGNVIVWEYSPL